ncbi:MAG: hydrolase family protein [Bacteroidetes bacterium]|nr:hydrolase family protein [Bacteroidota bacterium]
MRKRNLENYKTQRINIRDIKKKKKNMKRIIIFTIFILTITLIANSQENNYFKAGDRICFVGNSITKDGEFIHNILLYQITRYPNQQINIFNCGIPGDVTQDVLDRLETDILIHKPTKVVIMIGMNDIKRWFYGSKITSNADTLQLQQEAINLYKKNLAKLLSEFQSRSIGIILQTPTIYDQTAKFATENKFGSNDALKVCADFVCEQARKFKLPLVDYWTLMAQLNKKIQKEDPMSTIIGMDRIHPGSDGHLVMAYQFLKADKAPKFVSKICIYNNNKKSALKSCNCEIKNVSLNKNKVTFTVKENSLPFPTKPQQTKSLSLIPFVDEFNVELLKVPVIKPGNYKLTIDGVLVGEFTGKQLQNGVNLTSYSNTPQYQQAIKVRDLLWKAHEEVSKLRGVKFIEYNPYFSSCKNKDNLSNVQVFMDSVFSYEPYKSNPYYKARLKDYMIYKPLEKEIENASIRYNEIAYSEAKPKEHTYIIELDNTKN